ncbi:MAG: RNA polymerase sigma-70 factor (ECF subfamily) [Flavobacterium sp.]|jgi:RNA polymerase sigma-70 factor (ECF subfamily)
MASTVVAFEILYKEYFVRVFGLCRRLLNSALLAEDATQETFMRAFRSFSKYDSSQPFWYWIASIANHYCIDLLRKRSKTQQLFGDEQSELEQIESPGPHALTAIIDSEDSKTLNAALNDMPDKYRVPLVLAYFSELSYEEIASELCLSRNHVGVLLLRGKQHLRSRLIADENRGPEE